MSLEREQKIKVNERMELEWFEWWPKSIMGRFHRSIAA